MEKQPIIGKIKKVPLRDIWKKEDKEFTRWLENNIENLNDVLDIDLNIISREKKVGPFKVDLYAETNQGEKVIIENQLEKTNHDHLGKLLTYMINLEAKIAIWIAKDPTDEHAKVIEWLNEITPDDNSFYSIKIEAIKIGDQPMAAPLFTIIKGPSEISKQIGEEKKEYAERYFLLEEFWTKLLKKANEKTQLLSNVSPRKSTWIATGAGKSGIRYNFVMSNKEALCDIYLDRGKDFTTPNINKIRFDELYKHKNDIEKKFGGKLNWERLDHARASRISYRYKSGGIKDKDKWDEIQDKLIDAMIRLEKSTKEYIEKLD